MHAAILSFECGSCVGRNHAGSVGLRLAIIIGAGVAKALYQVVFAWLTSYL